MPHSGKVYERNFGGSLMSSKIKTMTVITLTALAVLASGCNTIQGVGDDIKSAGKKGEEVIKDK